MRVPLLSPVLRWLRPWRRRGRARRLQAAGRQREAIVTMARVAPGMFAPDEIGLLYETVRATPGPGDIAEIGSWKGRSAIVMALALRDEGDVCCRIFAIDHFAGSAEHAARVAREGGSTLDAFRRNVRVAGVSEQIQPLVMDSVAGARHLAERGVRLRLCLIDGAHDEESVRRDIRAIAPLVRPGGIVALHDCEPDGVFPGVWKAYEEELRDRVDELGRASSLLVARIRG